MCVPILVTPPAQYIHTHPKHKKPGVQSSGKLGSLGITQHKAASRVSQVHPAGKPTTSKSRCANRHKVSFLQATIFTQEQVLDETDTLHLETTKPTNRPREGEEEAN